MKGHLKPETPVQYLKGVGPKRAERLEKLGIGTIEELLFHIPARYIDRSNTTTLSKTQVGEEGTFIVKVLGASMRRSRRGPIVQILVTDGTAQIYVVWFNRRDLAGKFKVGERLLVSGQITFYGQVQLVNPFFDRLDENPGFFAHPVFAVYPLTEGLSTWEVRRMVEQALDNLTEFPETLPSSILQKRKLPSILESLRNIHRPESMDKVKPALDRLRYEELFYFSLLVGMRRSQLDFVLAGQALEPQGQLTDAFRSSLPFDLTSDQKNVIAEIATDISTPKPMHRLLQGDVGSGKTVVALYAMLAAAQSGKQAAMMAPTEILAEQHYQGWSQQLTSSGAKPILLTGSMGKSEKETAQEQIARGQVDIVFGTHALIQENVSFNNLALVVVDEQHRFGVMQRAALARKGEIEPHVLVMTATPIPRTLTLSYYGDLEVSTIREKPPGRQEVKTDITNETHRQGVYKWLSERLTEGDRAFVVCPLIDESEKLEVSSAKETFDELSAIFAEKVALIHGRMKREERVMAMEKFRQGQVQVLVSTTVIEVGVDVPEATIMIIRHPERFGLAQLHQLRGRIGRGDRASRCLLLLPPRLSPEARERLLFFSRTSDGFELAEEDLRIRGPGQVMGTRQHGLPDLKIADLVRDNELLINARDDAFALLANSPRLDKFRRTAATVRRRYAKSLEFLGVA